MTSHPAKFSDAVLAVIGRWLAPGDRVLDPFGGVGTLAKLDGLRTVCVEIEKDWATQIVGDALALPFRADTFDAVATSPVFGNRMSDHHDAKDASRRHTYKHYLGHDLHPNNSGQMQWGDQYRDFHRLAWAETVRCLKPGRPFVLNSSNHIRRGQIQLVTDWHVDALKALGLHQLAQIPVGTSRLRHGANYEVRVDHETVTVFMKGKI